ncbi:cytochrome P450 [Mariannaea sp. PMI_226]|nr:cytochrome P450 [Mariannaea sp. PMI_226]
MAVIHSVWGSLASKSSNADFELATLILEGILLVFFVYVIVPLLRSLIRSVQSQNSHDFYSDSDSKIPLHSGLLPVSKLPNISSTIPWIGHLLGLQRDSARYVNSLIASTAAPIFTINIPFKRIIVANPSMDRNLSRHTSETGLAQILAYVGPRVFSLGPKTIQVILDCDPRSLHKVEFGAVDNLKALSERSGVFVWDEMNKLPARSEMDLAHWMFGLTVSATASAVWGVQNPWRMDREFAEEFMNLSETFDSLSRPFARFTARSAYKSRKFLSNRLREFHHQHRESRVRTVAHGINVVAHSDPNWESNPDYFNIEMVSALGLLATPSTLSVWLMRHLLAAPDMLHIIVNEVQQLGDVIGEDSGIPRLDLSNVRTLCPWLVASWYETLRLHMTGVPRLARNDFNLNLPGSDPLAVSQGDIFLLPMCASNLDPMNWGPDAASFIPGRFINGDGTLNNSLIRKVRAFGVAGNLCPGRVFGFEVAMMVVAGMLRDFSIESLDARDFWVPGVRKGFNVGFERYADDVKVALVRR